MTPRRLKPARQVEGTLTVPGDKSIGHRVALLSLLAHEPINVINFPGGADCRSSLEAAKTLGVRVEQTDDRITLIPPQRHEVPDELIIDCGNSGTTARLLAGIIAGSGIEVTLAGDESLSRRPMRRIIEPLTTMGARIFADGGHLPMRIQGRKLLPLEYRLPVASAQVKSSLLLAGLASGCSVVVREDNITRDHSERLINHIGHGIEVRDVKPVFVQDPVDPRKRRLERQESFKREISLDSQAVVVGGDVDIPGDISTAAFFWAGAAISGGSVTIRNVGLNPTRTGVLDYLKSAGCKVEIADKETISGEPRGTVTVVGGELKPRKLSGSQVTGVIDEIPIIAVMAAFAQGTTVIRDAGELRVKETDRLAAVARNLELMGVKCGLLEDGLAVEGTLEVNGADFESFGDHRIAMAFSVAALSAVGPSTIDDVDCIGISCPEFYELLDSVVQ